MPCAVSGRRYTCAASSSTGPMQVLNIRLKRRGGGRGPVAAATGLALNEGVGEVGDMAGGDPDLGRHDDAGVEANDVRALLDHCPPPGPLDVVLELDAELPVVPHGVDSAVDLRAREYEAAPLGQRNNRFE